MNEGLTTSDPSIISGGGERAVSLEQALNCRRHKPLSQRDAARPKAQPTFDQAAKPPFRGKTTPPRKPPILPRGHNRGHGSGKVCASRSRH